MLPSPWPKGQLTPPVYRLVQQVAAIWPDGHPAHRVADRACPG